MRDLALELLGSHPLRAADALQLAAAIIAAECRPGSVEFISLDQRLSAAARVERFTLVEFAS